METARQLAVALHIPTTGLVAGHRTDEADPATMDHWAPARRALLAPAGGGGLDEPPTMDGVRAAIDAALPLFSSDRFSELSTVLPGLLRDADALVDVSSEGRRVRGHLMQLTGWLFTQTRQFDAAEVALGRAMDDASDRLDGAATVSTECWLLLRRGRVADARDLSVRWADEVEPRLSRATPEELSAWGWLLLRVSAAAIRDNRPGEAEDALRLAQSAAVATGREWAPGGEFLRAFGPVTVALKRAENAMVADRPDRVLQLAAKIPTSGMRPTSNNWNRHRLDVANAHVRQRQYADAVDVLHDVWRTAPQWLPNQRYARDIMRRIVAKRRTLTPEMRGLADAVALPM